MLSTSNSCCSSDASSKIPLVCSQKTARYPGLGITRPLSTRPVEHGAKDYGYGRSLSGLVPPQYSQDFVVITYRPTSRNRPYYETHCSSMVFLFGLFIACLDLATLLMISISTHPDSMIKSIHPCWAPPEMRETFETRLLNKNHEMQIKAHVFDSCFPPRYVLQKHLNPSQ